MKTTKKQFRQFCGEFERFVVLFGLQDWTRYYRHIKLQDAYAEITLDCPSRIATIKFCDEIEDRHLKEWNGVKQTALHEMCHMLIADYAHAIGKRYCEEAIDQAEEALVVRLENLMRDFL